jgi:hypothetical protein
MEITDQHLPETLNYATPESRKKAPIPPEIMLKIQRLLRWALGLWFLWAILAHCHFIFTYPLGMHLGTGHLFVLKPWAMCIGVLIGLAGIIPMLKAGWILFQFRNSAKRIQLMIAVLLILLLYFPLGCYVMFANRAIIRDRLVASDGKTYYSIWRFANAQGYPSVGTDRISFGFADHYRLLGWFIEANKEYNWVFSGAPASFHTGEIREGRDGCLVIYGQPLYILNKSESSDSH